MAEPALSELLPHETEAPLEPLKPGPDRFLGSSYYPDHDFRKPNFDPIYADRNARWERCENDPEYLARLKEQYSRNPMLFIVHWAMTFDPRKAAKAINDPSVTATMPMVMFRRQEQLLAWVWRKILVASETDECEHAIVDKSRECGATWVTVWLSVWALLFVPGFVTGFGSRTQDYVDRSKDMKAFFQRVIWSLEFVPDFLKPEGWVTEEHYAKNRISNEHIGSIITGEAGANIGRGDRTSVYFVDEKAACRDGDGINRALSANTDCHIDISTPGDGGDFHSQEKEERIETDDLFVFDHTDDPRKGKLWEEKKREQVGDTVFAIEYGRDEFAGDSLAFIPNQWLQACVDAHERLGLFQQGVRKAGFDPADTGDAKAITVMHGPIIIESMQMTKGNHFVGNVWGFNKATDHAVEVMGYDADGLGVGLPQSVARPRKMPLAPFKGKTKVREPNEPIPTSGGSMDFANDATVRAQLRKNGEFFANRRAQAWWAFRVRVQNTYDCITTLKEGKAMPAKFAPDDLISISSRATDHRQLVRELSRPRVARSGRTGLMLVESKEDMKKRGVKSPNLADSAVICNFTLPPAVDKDSPAGTRWATPDILKD